MYVVDVFQKKTAIMIALLALVAALAIGVVGAKVKCVLRDDYGTCIMWELVDERPGGSGLTDLLGGG